MGRGHLQVRGLTSKVESFEFLAYGTEAPLVNILHWTFNL